MELVVVLLVIGLSSSEKLYRGYLPPPGANFAGGSSGDLQTPLEYPNEYTNFESGERGYEIGERQPLNVDIKSTNHNSLFGTVPNNDEAFSTIGTENPNGYTQTTMYPGNGFDTVATTAPKIDNNADIQNKVADNRYPMKGISIFQGTESFGNGYHYGKPENMPINTAKAILNNYKPGEFGTYGGSPMIMKSYPDPQADFSNKFVKPNGHSNLSSNNLHTADEIRRGTQTDISTSLNANNSGTKIYESSDALNKVNETFQKKPQRPQADTDKTAAVLNYKNIITPEEYTYSFDTSNGIHIDETATTIDGVKTSGSYSYTGDDGKVYSVIYTADENGFQPKGDHLPTPPPIPEAIQKVIEQAKIEKEAGISHDGSYDEEKYGHMKYQGPVDRYLLNMPTRFKPRNRNRGNGFRKINRKPTLSASKETDDYRVHRNNDLQRNKNLFERPVDNLNGQFGMRNHIAVQKNNQKTLGKLQKTLSQNPRKSLKQGHSESNIKIKTDEQKNNNIQNKEDRSPYVVMRKPFETHNHYQGVNSSKHIHEYKDPGYYYVPPRQIFVEGRIQDIPTDIKTPNELSNFYEDFKSIPKDEYYYVDQRSNNDSPKYQSTTMNSNFTTDGPELNTQTYVSSFYDRTNHDNDESNSSEVSASKSKNEVITLVKTPTYGNTLSTDAYDHENTRNYQEDTIFPEQRDETVGILEQKDASDVVNLSTTTPMTSETKYLDVLSKYNKYGGVKPSKGVGTTEYASKEYEEEGYFITKPDVPISFEDFPSSTYLTYTVNKTQTETIPNIKVDGFGRPIQDSQRAHGSTIEFGYTETPVGRADDGPKPTIKFHTFDEPVDMDTTPQDDNIVQFNLDNIKETKNEIIEDSDKIVGEDFSGPKQPQRYDPTSGYFY